MISKQFHAVKYETFAGEFTAGDLHKGTKKAKIGNLGAG